LVDLFFYSQKFFCWTKSSPKRKNAKPSGKIKQSKCLALPPADGLAFATLLPTQLHMPKLHVVVLEKDSFPRDHVGESQLPAISKVLHEMGAWQKVQAAEFPIKLGASYTWGKSPATAIGNPGRCP
jgi:hypothetical protein